MSEIGNFFEKLGGNLENGINRTTNTLFNIASIPNQLANTVANIGNGIGGFLSSPLSGIAIPIIGLVALQMFANKK